MTNANLAEHGRYRATALGLGLAVLFGAGILTVAKAALPADMEDLARTARFGLRTAAAPAGQPLPAAPAAAPPPEIAFVAPAPGYVVDSPFGLRRLPWEARGRLHAGVDIAAPLGTPVSATADGVVTSIGNSLSYGRFVEVAHADGVSSFYAHLRGQAVAEGTVVKAGQIVGFMGDTGDSTGSHLHFEIRKGGAALNPALFVGRSFAKAADLPLRAAAWYGPLVRIAQVSGVPARHLGAVRSTPARVHGLIEMVGAAAPAEDRAAVDVATHVVAASSGDPGKVGQDEVGRQDIQSSATVQVAAEGGA